MHSAPGAADPQAPPPAKRPRGRPPKTRLLSLKPKSASSSSSSITKKRGRMKLLSPTRPSKVYYTPSITSSSMHTNSIGPSFGSNSTSGGVEVSVGGHHRLRNRAAIQRPVYFRDSFFVLEEAIAYSKLQKKHKERKRKIATHTQKPTVNTSLQSSQKQSTPDPANNQNHAPSHPLQPSSCAEAKPADPCTKKPDLNPPAHPVPNLDKYMFEEKAFMELLVCFMRMRNTPIRHVPKLGSKKCKMIP